MTTSAAGGAGTAERSAILLVDDMEDNLIALEAVLGSLGPQLVRAVSGEEALKAMLRQEFAVVLLDVMMPGMDGFETAANIKRLDQTKDVPIILLTGNDAGPDYAYRGYSVGAADFLTKPFDPWLLRTKVGVFLELHRKNRQLAEQAEQLRRLLVTGSPDGRTAAERTRARGAGTPPSQPSPPAAREERLLEITEQLTQVELLLRDQGTEHGVRERGGGGERGADGEDQPAGLADRVASLERAIGTLLTTRDR